MNYITKDELDNKELTSTFSIKNDELIFDENSPYKNDFQVGDIVTLKNDSKQMGVVSFIEEDELNINWDDSRESVEVSSNLIIVPPTLGIQLFKNNDLLNLWENLSNGKNDSFDLKCLYINDKIVNEVTFIRAYKNTDTLVDKRFKRTFSLYRKFGNTQIFRTNLYTIDNKNVGFNSSRFVYYLLQDNVVYYLGIDLSRDDLNTYLFKK
ncbi:hypothetical protein [Terrisporobacter hibernicus]|uniref:Uncharacterized protein n=2 Tax=Terrisporobacter hibernicus TaxID=2813371 RepID=A0AAX2ZHJ7_9FIRM|nr:hypothetical protein [Terrisporobacter hibernicus]UEL47880.1 hypothetical protein JW646_00055 [Terrisporobacter hibernicus]SFJ23381.1 hypothetical protein SAMN02910355_1696 [Terrisporobacter glycolicus]